MRLHDVDRVRRGSSIIGPDIEPAAAACALVHADRAMLLDGLARHSEHDAWVIAVARAKATLAHLSAAADLAPDRIAVGTRFAFSIGGREPDVAVLAPWDEEPAPLGRIALRTRLGIAALGMKAGASVDVPRHDGTVDRVTVREVLYQPGDHLAPDGAPANDNRAGQEVRP
jgi:transcription elongation GreA/GreB family factor